MLSGIVGPISEYFMLFSFHSLWNLIERDPFELFIKDDQNKYI